MKSQKFRLYTSTSCYNIPFEMKHLKNQDFCPVCRFVIPLTNVTIYTMCSIVPCQLVRVRQFVLALLTFLEQLVSA